MNFKYIIVRKGNREVPFIFPEDSVHALMLSAVHHMFATEILTVSPDMDANKVWDDIQRDVVCVGAGSVTLDVGSAAGRSETLEVSSRPKDAALIQNYPYTHGIVTGDDE